MFFLQTSKNASRLQHVATLSPAVWRRRRDYGREGTSLEKSPLLSRAETPLAPTIVLELCGPPPEEEAKTRGPRDKKN